MMGPNQREVSRNYRAALARYLGAQGAPRRGEIDHLEMELLSLERSLAFYPPSYQNAEGVWMPSSTGLITADEARANATPEGLIELDALLAPVAPRIRDDFKIIPEREWSDAIQQKKQDEAENRGLVKFTLDQNGYGSCASEGIAGCTMFCEEKQGSPVELLNALGLYRYVNGGRDGGSSLSDNIAAARRYGIPTEEAWSRSNGWRTPLSDEAKQDALWHRPDEIYRVSDKTEFGTALLLGFVVYAGYSGHAWFAVDLIDTVRFLWMNSWGPDWADSGFSSLRFSELMWGYGCWAVQTARRAA